MSNRGLIRGPKWRTRTTEGRRRSAARMTFAIIAGLGALPVAGTMWLLNFLGAPAWLVIAPWLIPTVAVLGWVLWRPGPAVPTDDDDDTWAGYAMRHVLVGDEVPRPPLVRAAAAVLFGAPVAWMILLFGLASLVGLF